jgi:hypothetical protein
MREFFINCELGRSSRCLYLRYDFVYTLLISSMRATYPVNLIQVDLITPIISIRMRIKNELHSTEKGRGVANKTRLIADMNEKYC